jgi:hypothetical protein
VIDREVEQRAAETLFFSERVHEGHTQRLCHVNYLALLNLTVEVPGAVAGLRRLLAAQTPAKIEADLYLLLEALNWRFHLLACGTMLSGHTSPSIIAAAWLRLRRGSWVSPQIAATCRIVDPEFLLQAAIVFLDPAASPKALLAIHALSEGALRLDGIQESRLAAAAAQDQDHAREIALRWREDAERFFR